MQLNKSFFVIYSGDIVSRFEELNINNYYVLNNNLVVVYVDNGFDEEKFKEVNEVVSVIESSAMSSLIEINNKNLDDGETIKEASGIDYVSKNPYLNLTGKNVLVAIIDSGIDYLNKDFVDENGKSKILTIWDQEKQNGKDFSNVPFGTEISNEEINEAIKNNDNNLTSDNVGTGTVCAGIICGNGNNKKEYKGICKDCELIVVKLKSCESRYLKSKVCYKDTDFLAGVRYVLDVAKKHQKPVIINLTVGAISSEVNGLNLLDTFDELSEAGNFVIGGAGNQGNTGIHYLGKIDNINDIKDVIVEVGIQNSLDILFELRDIDKVSLQVISPSGEASYIANYSPEDFSFSGKFNTENTEYTIDYKYPDILTARQKTKINLKNVKPGIWTIRIIPEFLIFGEFNLYLPNNNLISKDTKFLNPDSISTITTYSSGKNIITVGTFNDKTDSMWLGSSQGSNFGDFLKPDIVASGVDIISSFINNSYKVSTGSGVSSSITTGIVALIIQYLIEQSEFTRFSVFPQVIKTYLMLGTRKKDIYKYPNISQGYGILNLENTIKQISNNL